MKNRKLKIAASIFLGAIFIFSAIGKIIDTRSFIELTYSYGFEFLDFFTPLLPGVEIAIGFFLLFLVRTRVFALISLLLLIIFTIAFAYANLTKGIDDCGFSLIPVKFPPIVTYIRNITLIGISFWLWQTYPYKNTRIPAYKYIIIAVISAYSFIATGYTIKTPINIKSKLVGMSVKKTSIPKFAQISPDSTYLLFIFGQNCPYCWDATENIKKYKEMSVVDSIIGLTFHAGDTLENQYREQCVPNFSINYFEKDSLKQLTNKIPTAIFIKNDSIKFLFREEIFSPLRFSYFYKF